MIESTEPTPPGFAAAAAARTVEAVEVARAEYEAAAAVSHAALVRLTHAELRADGYEVEAVEVEVMCTDTDCPYTNEHTPTDCADDRALARAEIAAYKEMCGCFEANCDEAACREQARAVSWCPVCPAYADLHRVQDCPGPESWTPTGPVFEVAHVTYTQADTLGEGGAGRWYFWQAGDAAGTGFRTKAEATAEAVALGYTEAAR